MRRFFASPENFDAGSVALNLAESKHLREVLRLRENDQVQIFNGEGQAYLCTIEKLGRGHETTKLLIEQEIDDAPAAESNLDLTLGVALLKGEKFDLVVQKTTELGVNKIVPLQTKRADVRLKDEKEIAKKLERWQRIALEAAKQSGRSVLPQIEKPVAVESFLRTSNDADLKFFLAERRGHAWPENPSVNHQSSKAVIVIGAEGGWEDSEIEAASTSGFTILTLGARILRAETAAIAAVTLMQHRYGDLR